MKGASRFIGPVIWFLTGVFLCYILTQFVYFEIDKHVNVPEIIINIISLLVGVYIAITLQQRFNRNQNLYNFLINKLDNLWSEYNGFYAQIDATEQFQLSTITKFFKDFQQKIDVLKTLLQPFGFANEYIDDLEKNIDELEDLLCNKSMIKNNIVVFEQHKSAIKGSNTKISQSLVSIFNGINNNL